LSYRPLLRGGHFTVISAGKTICCCRCGALSGFPEQLHNIVIKHAHNTLRRRFFECIFYLPGGLLVCRLPGGNLCRQRITGLIRLCRQLLCPVDKLVQGVSGARAF
jgi:hypothetical protein